MAGTALGTDWLGRSHAQTNLRRHYKVDRYYIVQAAINSLAKGGGGGGR
jgi:pyruvate dehydrogenase E1 component